VAEITGRKANRRDVLSYLLYPKVFESSPLIRRNTRTPACSPRRFSSTARTGEEFTAEIEEGKTLVIRFLTISDSPRDAPAASFRTQRPASGCKHCGQVAGGDGDEAGASRPEQSQASRLRNAGDGRHRRGQTGDKLPGQKLFTLEAMKMETTISSEVPAWSRKILVNRGVGSEAGDLMLTLG